MKLIPAFEHYPNSRFLGFSLSQNRYAVSAWSYLFEQYRPSRIIEIGTSVGGFTCLLGIVAQNIGAVVHTFDTGYLHVENAKWFKILGINYHREDVFGEVGYSRIRCLVEMPGQVVVLCDGGNKVKEFNEFGKLLKSGDVIAAHDFCTGPEWPWGEIRPEDIEATVKSQNLEPYLSEVFYAPGRTTGWAVWRKG